MNFLEAVSHALYGIAFPSDLDKAKSLIDTLNANGVSLIDKGDADMLERIRQKTGGKHPTAPGFWNVASGDGWVRFRAGRDAEYGMFCPADAREIAMALIYFAEQEEKRRP